MYVHEFINPKKTSSSLWLGKEDASKKLPEFLKMSKQTKRIETLQGGPLPTPLAGVTTPVIHLRDRQNEKA